jgi:hypothetical protein
MRIFIYWNLNHGEGGDINGQEKSSCQRKKSNKSKEKIIEKNSLRI